MIRYMHQDRSDDLDPNTHAAAALYPSLQQLQKPGPPDLFRYAGVRQDLNGIMYDHDDHAGISFPNFGAGTLAAQSSSLRIDLAE